MSSILKILVDCSCEVYCDFELKGNAVPQSLFKLELRQGTYMLDFKNNGELLYSQEYVMQSNEQEDLLKVSLKGNMEEKQKEERIKHIEQMNVSLEFHDEKYWIRTSENDKEIEVKYKLKFNDYSKFDECGLLLAYIGEPDEYGIPEVGSLFGCINKLGEVQIPFIYDGICPFENNQVTTAYTNGKTLFINKYGEIAFENVYDEVGWYIYNICIISKNGKRGGINECGDVVIPIIYDDIDYIYSFQWYVLTINGKKGVCGYDGTIRIPVVYDEIEGCGKGLILATKDSKKCVYTNTGEIIIPMIYDSIKYNYWDLHGFILSSHGKFGLYSFDGSVIIPIQYDDLQVIGRGHVIVTKGGKKGVYTDDGRCVLDIKYDNCEGTCVCSDTFGGAVYDDYYIVTLDGKMGIVDDKGAAILAIEYEKIKGLEGNLKLIYYKNSWQIYDVRQKELLQVLFHDYSKGWGRQLITQFNEPKMHYNLYDYEKRDYLLYNADDIQKSSKGWCYIVSNNGKKGLVNDEGEWIYDVCFDDIVVRKETVVAKLNSNIVIYDYDGNILFDKHYQVIDELAYRLGYTWGLNSVGRDRIFMNEPILCKRDGKWGCVNKNLWDIEYSEEIPYIKEFIPCIYDEIAYGNKEIVTPSNIDKNDGVCYFIKKESNGDLHFFEYEPFEDQPQNDVAVIKKDWVEQSEDSLFLFFDTETTGLPQNYETASSDTKNWPRLVQLSWILTTSKGKILNRGNYIVKPQGFIIPKASSDIHGISTEYAISHGTKLGDVIVNFIADFTKANKIVGHNIDFDKKIIGAEMYRMGMADIMDSKEVICTMKSSVGFCKLPGSLGYKYPTLQELYKKLFNKNFDKAHNAESDILATMECYFELVKRGII